MAGLVPKPSPGRPRKHLYAKRDVIMELFANPKEPGEDCWTKQKFRGDIQRELHVEPGYSTLARYLREEGFRLLVPRPEAPEGDPEERAEFKELLTFLAGRQCDQFS